MPSAFGKHRGAAAYYQYGGMPMRGVFNWTGVPQTGARFGQASLGDTVSVAQTMTYPYERSVLHTGPEQWATGALALSDNERLWGGLALAGIAGFFIWKKMKKK